MKHTTPEPLIARDLLCFVRDLNPTVDEFIARFGGVSGECFHVLRKHQVVVVDGGRVRLNRRHLSPDGRRFHWGVRVYRLDRDEVWTVNYGPEGQPPVFHPDA